MGQVLHGCATTTHAVRTAIQRSKAPLKELAARYGLDNHKKLKMLAVTSRYRLQALPNVPTVEESGVPGFDTTAWMGVMGPAGIPPAIREKLSAALVDIARDPDTQAKLRKIGFEPIGKDAAAFQEFFRGDVKKWTDFVKDRGLKETQ